MGGHSTQTTDAKIAGIQIQTSLLGQPIPLGWGRARLSCNLIDYVAFTATPHTTTQSSGGGKGFGGSSSSTTYTYTASVEMALCEGPITGIVSVFKDASAYAGGTALTDSGLNAALGGVTQAPWAYMTSLFPSHALSYPGIAYIYAQDYALSTTASLANHSFEIDFATQLGAGVNDADPKDIITDALTNTRYGVSGWGSGLLSTTAFADYSLYCRANNLLLSPVLDQPVPAKDFIKRIMSQTNSDVVWSEGALKIKPFGDAAATGNGVTWTPNLAPVFDLNEDCFLDEVTLEIVNQADAHNLVQVEYLDRANQYQPAIVPASDLDNIVNYGLRKQDPQSFHDICNGSTARQVAQLWLQRNLYVRDLYHFSLPMDFIALEPMDYVTLTTTVDGMTLNRQLVMILSIDEDPDGQDVLHLVAEGVPGAIASAAIYAAHTATSFQPAVTADPGNVATPLLINAPTSLTVTGYEAWAAVAGTNANWGGANVWVSFDGTNYSQIGTITAPGTFGTLTATLAAVADPDITSTLAVNLTPSRGSLPTVTQAEADAGATICLVDNELIGFRTATLTAANKYNLTYLRRGMRGSIIGSHAIGGKFVRLNDGVFRYAYPAANAGQVMSVKFQSFNVYGKALQSLSVCTAYTLTLAQATSLPAQPTGLGIAGGGTAWTGATISLICSQAAGATSYRFDIFKADGTTLLRSITSSTSSAAYTALQAQVDGTQLVYVVKVVAINAGGSSPASSPITITNPAPIAVTTPAIAGGAYTAVASCDVSSSTDLAGYILFYSNTAGFAPLTAGTVLRSGSNSISVYSLAAGTYYGRIAAYDLWTSNPTLINLSAEISFTITTGGGTAPSGGGGGYTIPKGVQP
jgi:hypothetical protein